MSSLPRLAHAMGRVLALAATTLGITAPAMAQLPGGAVVTTDQVRAELVAHAPEGVVTGKPVWLGLKIEHQPEWHTYWRNPGDSGLPTTMAWSLPPGFGAGQIVWPTPIRLPVGPLMNYGYEGTLLLPVQLDVPAGFDAASVPIKLQAQWLVCKDVCIPQQGDFTLALPTRAATALHGALFDATLAAEPKTVATVKAAGELRGGEALALRVTGLPAQWQGKPLQLFAELGGVVDHAAKPQAAWQGDGWQATLPLSRERTESPSAMHAVLVAPGERTGIRVAFDVAGTWPALPGAMAAPTSTAPNAAPVAARSSHDANASMTLLAAVAFALVGGLLLNLMPCVLPVLSLKVLKLASHRDDAGTRIGTGVAYTLGVVLSFLALAGVLLALRAGGEAVGWGFQLQSPGVVAALAILFTLIGLNLAGTFEVGSMAPSAWAAAQLRHPWADAALTGVLAVAVAAPCTAPFMGAALGYAVSLPAMQALLVFAVLGLGLATPFLLVALSPTLARWLPRPGAWMQRFKVAMAFPMFATVVWLVWVLGQQTSIDGAAALLATLVVVAFAAWAWSQRGARFAWLWRAAGVAAGVLVLLWAAPLWRASEAQASSASAVPGAVTSSDAWEPWTPERLAAHRTAGRTVFVDYTAAWCVTCQVNKRSTLARAEVVDAFKRQGVVTMRADWTRRDAAIAAELARLGRTGVPVYAIYRAPDAPPQLLPELLTPAIVLEALAASGPSAGRVAIGRP